MATTLADDISKCIFLYGNDRIPIISLQLVPKRIPIDNKPALIQVMAWRRTGGGVGGWGGGVGGGWGGGWGGGGGGGN